MSGCLLIGLTAGKESDARHRSWYRRLEAAYRLLCYLLARGLTCILAVDHHVRLKHHAFERDTGIVKLGEDRLQHALGDLIAAADGVVPGCAIHQDLGLHDRHNTCLLAQGSIAGECLRVLLYGAPA